MTAPTPADLHPPVVVAAGPIARPADRIFDTAHTPGKRITPAQQRSRLLIEALNRVERLKTSLIALRTAPVDDLDLNLEAMYRHEERARRALDQLIVALAAGPAAPVPTARYRA